MADEPNQAPNQASKKSGALDDLVKAESMIQLAIALPAGCLIGWLIGSWLDRHFHQGWIAIAGIILGAIAGFVQIFVTASRFLKNDRSDQQ
ncbi:MAG: AtpZ/AtpI family protein [Edaphobacter sp.]